MLVEASMIVDDSDFLYMHVMEEVLIEELEKKGCINIKTKVHPGSLYPDTYDLIATGELPCETTNLS